MGNRARFDFEQIAGAGNISHDIGRCEIGRASEAGIEMRGLNNHAPERKIGKAGIELGLWMPRQKSPAQVRFVARVACNFCKPAEHGQPRMRKRIALAGGSEQQRCAAVASRLAVWLESRDTRISGDPSLSVATLTSEPNGCPVLRSIVASAPARIERSNFFAVDLASKSGVGAVSGSRSGMAPGSGRSGSARLAPSGRLDLAIEMLLGAIGIYRRALSPWFPLVPFGGRKACRLL